MRKSIRMLCITLAVIFCMSMVSIASSEEIGIVLQQATVTIAHTEAQPALNECSPSPSPTPTPSPLPQAEGLVGVSEDAADEAANSQNGPTDIGTTVEPMEVPEVMTDPAMTEEPEVSPTPTPTPTPPPGGPPEGTEEPGETELPEATEDPEATDEPEATIDPDATAAPDATEETEVGNAPETTDAASTQVPEGEVIPEPTPDPNATPEPEAIEEILVIQEHYPSSWYGVVPEDGQGMPIPILYQRQYTQPVEIIDGRVRSVATSGCGPTSLSMIIAYLTGDTDQDPYKLFKRATQIAGYHGAGVTHDTLSALASEYGVHSKWIDNDADQIIAALKAGKPIIAHMGPGVFTSGGHYIVLRGVTDDGLIIVNDPASSHRTGRAYTVSSLIKQARMDCCFMVCW